MARKLYWLDVQLEDYRRQIAAHLANSRPESHSSLETIRKSPAASQPTSTSTEFERSCCEALAWIALLADHTSEGNLATVVNHRTTCSPFAETLLSTLDNFCWAPLQKASDNVDFDPLRSYETYLSSTDPKQRLQRGVFYTPRVVAKHVVSQIDRVLRIDFGLADGLADRTTWNKMQASCPTLVIPEGVSGDAPFVKILDPAAGTGVFLLEVIRCIHNTMLAKWRSTDLTARQIVEQWNAYVSEHLLKQLFAVELMMTPCVISQVVVAQELAALGYRFKSEQRLQFALADTLLAPTLGDSASVRYEPFTVVLGNPPFRGVSSNPSSWISKLLRGQAPNGVSVANYYAAEGSPLNERKLWLQDDYVKFFRYAHWQIEQAGAGVVGFLTNHGYLDNATFRGMRHAMLETFDGIQITDLHGDRKKHATTSPDRVDESVFDIDQGVAIGLFSRSVRAVRRYTRYHEVWGSRQDKTEALATDSRSPTTDLKPQSPDFLFVPSAGPRHAEYEAAFALNDIMPLNSTAVVTARDSFVVAFDEDTLLKRMRDFADDSLSDDEIRKRYFNNSRSTKYPPGDTRGWKLSKARQRMRQVEDISRFVQPCSYRPFDRRVIFWADWMIDWPRANVMQHMLPGDNLALIARRQMPPTGNCSYFWITATIALDGLIRSDNRGGESVFPLWVTGGSESRHANFDTAFIECIQDKLDQRFVERNDHSDESCLTAADVFHYMYGLFHSPTYQQRYADYLRRGFPRVPVPNSKRLWKRFRHIGEQLVKLHLSQATRQSPLLDHHHTSSSSPISIRARYPQFSDGKIRLEDAGTNVAASERVWNYHVGTHQVCRKWLRDRKTISEDDLEVYKVIISAIERTLQLTDELDEAVATVGGWEAVFTT